MATEGPYQSEEDEKDFLIQAINAKNLPLNVTVTDRQKFVLSLSDNVFCDDSCHFAYNHVWRLRDNYTSAEINLFHKKIQYVLNLIAESQRGFIVCTTVCALLVIIQYLISHVVIITDGLGITKLLFGELETSRLITHSGLLVGKSIYKSFA